MERINFNQNLTKFHGRNGIFKCSGLTFNWYESLDENEAPFIEICPITSRGLTGRCFIRVPISHIREIINTLTKIETELHDESNNTLDTEICVKCGDSVKRGSGKFVNRIPVVDDFETKKEMRNFPEGEFICEECDNALE